MTLQDFLTETQQEVRQQLSEGQLYPELAFAEVMMLHLANIGMTVDPAICHHEGQYRNAVFRLTGYAISEDGDQLDLFVCLYGGVDVVTNVNDSETRAAVEQCLRFLERCTTGALVRDLDDSSEVKALANLIQEHYNGLDQVRVFVLTDKVARAKSFRTREVGGRSVKLEVMDIERLYRHVAEGKPRDELVVNFKEVSGAPIPCVYVPGANGDYDYALTAIPGEALRFIYDRYGPRLLEANVRSFLSNKGRGVNAGIAATIRNAPDRFMAYNNGVVLVTDEVSLERDANGAPGIAWLRGLQIVNGGQTTASIFFAKKKYPDTDLSQVWVAAKVIVMKATDSAQEEALISDISRFANSQNAVKQSDLSANKPFHVEVEKLSLSVYCPDGVSRWFYERAAGSYNTLLMREGSTAAKLRQLKETIPTARRITKTDLAKFINAWDCQPDLVSMGSQKNFDRFMSTLTAEEEEAVPPLPDVNAFKSMIAKAIIFKATTKLVRLMFQAFQANIVAYTIAVTANSLGASIKLERIWAKQRVSDELLAQIGIWAREVAEELHGTAGNRMVSEWAKRPECKQAMMAASYSPASKGIPECA
ncbi:hypothetical protein OKW30_003514 [Paraburkholderia sp. Clong3]|uniref:AIPR family protein n=1 Tax=Paraburkholderia sp. Clong3 TaxID=2991061 RepID=UPI003D1F0DAA